MNCVVFFLGVHRHLIISRLLLAVWEGSLGAHVEASTRVRRILVGPARFMQRCDGRQRARGLAGALLRGS